MDERNLATWWASQFVDAAYLNGLRHAVISPGSRSTPLALAFHAHPDIRTHVIIDERVAGFFALGIAKSTGAAAAVVTTSGTAVANLYPAVLEARASETPLLVLSADRPPLHRAIGASQTLDQIKIFADAPLFFHEVGEPRTDSGDVSRLRVLATQSLRIANGGGPVHLNFAFRKPLEPGKDFVFPYSVIGNRYSVKSPLSNSYQIPITKYQLPNTQRPILLAGPMHHRKGYGRLIAELALALDAPIFAEPGALDGTPLPESHVFPATDRFLKNIDPDLVIRFGHHPVSKGAEILLSKGIRQIHVFDGKQMQNPESVDIEWIDAPADTLRFEVTSRSEPGWMDGLNARKIAFMSKRDDILSQEPTFTDLHVHQALQAQLHGMDVMLSNSYPIRDADLMWTPANAAGGLKVFTNRGAAGIDGVTSTAAGIVAGSGRPAVLITGDVAFIHDLNALLTRTELPASLVVVVINNGGGTIFRMLPLDEPTEVHQRYFETPQDVDIAALCAGYKVDFQRFTSASSLADFRFPIPDSRITVIECVTDPSASMSIRKALASA
jgi:2-succinyl-5-enolpyruvyl-6-hydroxy-3-cyclohexene-1-carboxylate synthase